MTVFYCDPATALGAGAGTVGSGWNPEDVLKAGNPKGISVYDTVALITDGTPSTYYSLSAAAAITSVANQVKTVACDASGNATHFRAVLDASAQTTGAVFTTTHQHNAVCQIKAMNGPSSGFNKNTLYPMVYYGCDAEGNTTQGFYLQANRGVQYAYCRAWDNGSTGFYMYQGYSFYLSRALYRCASWDNGGSYEFDAAGGAGSQFVAACLGKASGSKSIFNLQHAQYAGGHYDCTAHNQAKSGAPTGFQVTSAAAVIANCMATGQSVGFSSSSYNGPLLIGANCNGNTTDVSGTFDHYETPNTTDPSYNNPSADDLAPTADLSGMAVPDRLAGESAWLQPGAIEVQGSSGGGGTGRRPAIRRHGG